MVKTNIHVLLIEDNPADALFLREALEDDALAVFHLSVVESLAQAFARLAEQVFDAALLDLGLPDSQGLPTFHSFHQRAPELPVVVLSALDDEELSQQAVQAGAQDYLVKRPQEFITARRALRYAIERKKSEQRFRTIFHTSPTPQIIFLAQTGRVVDANDAFGKLSGFEREEMIGQTTFELGLWRTPQDNIPLIQAFKAAGRVQDLELNIQTRAKEERTVIVSVEAIEIESEKRLLVSAVDITERKRAEKELKESEERFSTAFLNSPLAQSILDPVNDKVMAVNENCCQLFGYSREEVLGMSPSRFNLWENPADLASAVQELERTGRLLPRETNIRIKSGEIRTVIAAMEYISWKGNPCLISSVVDITARKQAESAQRKSEQRFKNLIKASSEVLFQLSPDWKTVTQLSSKGSLAAPGDSDDNWLNKYIHPDDQDKVNAAIQEAIRAKSVFALEHRVVGEDGSVTWVTARAIPVMDANGQIGEWFGAGSDITERKLAELALQKNEQLLRLFVEYSPAAIAMYDREMRFIIASRRFQTDYRLGGQSLAGRSHYDVFPETTERQKAIHRRCLAGGSESNSGAPFVRLDGTTDWVRWEILPWLDVNNRIGGIIFLSEVVTERKQAEDALAESEKRLRGALETTSDGFLIVDANGRINEVNPAYCRMTGYTREEILKMRVQDVEALEDSAATKAHIQRIAVIGSDRFETRHRRKDGSIIDVEISVNLLDPTSGLLICFCRNITERKAAERDSAYRQSLLEKVIQLGKKIAGITDLEQCLEEIYRSTRYGLGFDRVGLFIYDETLRSVQGVIGTSRTGEMVTTNLTRLSVEQWFGWLQALRHPMGLAYTADFQKEFNPPESDDMYGVGQHVLVTAWAGDEKPVAVIAADNLLTGKLITPADLEAFQLFAGYAGLAIENARMHTDLEKKVKERTAQVRDLYDSAPAGYHSLDANGRFTQVNQTELNWLGYTRDELIGRSIIDILTGESAALFRQTFPKFLATGFVRDLELEFVRKNGITFQVLVNAVARKDENGIYLNSRSTVVDITERKKADQVLRESEARLRVSSDQLRAANEALEKAARLKDEFLASMSHELRTPLTGILGLSEVLQEQVYGQLNDRQTRAVANIEASGRHLLELINDILDVSKLEAGMLELLLETCWLSQICQASLQMVRGMVQKKRQHIHFSMTPEEIVFEADPRRFKQILVNLLSNAVKYTPDGGSLGLVVEGNESEHAIQITVWDQGIGIQPADLEKLFQPFVQIDSSLSRQQSGTGLGLALVQHLVDLHGGNIAVESTFGAGSRFTISVPWVLPGSTRHPTPAGPEQPAETAQVWESGNPAAQVTAAAPEPTAPLVLVVEDNDIIRMTILDFLSSRRYRVASAGDAAEYLELLAREIPDLVLMDIQLPRMDGLEAIRRTRAHPDQHVAAVPIIALTALAMPGDQEKCFAAGANDYLSKPIRLYKLAAVMQTLFDRKE